MHSEQDTNERIYSIFEDVCHPIDYGMLDRLLLEIYDDPRCLSLMHSITKVPKFPFIYYDSVAPKDIRNFMSLFGKIERGQIMSSGIVVTRSDLLKPYDPKAARTATVFAKIRGTQPEGKVVGLGPGSGRATESQYIKVKLNKPDVRDHDTDEWDGENLFRISMHMPHESKMDNFFVVFCPSLSTWVFMFLYGEDLLAKTNNHPYIQRVMDIINRKKPQIIDFLRKKTWELNRTRDPVLDRPGKGPTYVSPRKLFDDNFLHIFDDVVDKHGFVPVSDVVGPIATTGRDMRKEWTWDEFLRGILIQDNRNNGYVLVPGRSRR